MSGVELCVLYGACEGKGVVGVSDAQGGDQGVSMMGCHV